MSSLVKIKVIYDYYSSKRVSVIFVNEEELLSETYEDFKARLSKEVDLSKITAGSLRLTVRDNGLDVDLSPKYYNLQMKSILDQDPSKNITLNALSSPAIEHLSKVRKRERDVEGEKREASTTALPTKEDGSCNAKRSLLYSDKSAENFSRPAPNTDNRILLPLERYSKKQQQIVDEIKSKLQLKRGELAKLHQRLEQSAQQNTGTLPVCGKCHLRLGHTKKTCSFSPCKSAYSCGFLPKHGSEKIAVNTLEKEVARLEHQQAMAESEVVNANRAADKVINSAPKQIEDIMISEFPGKYTSFGLSK